MEAIVFWPSAHGPPPRSLRLINVRFELDVKDERVEIDLERGDHISARRGILWGRLSFLDGMLRGLPKTSVARLNEEIAGVMSFHQRLVAERLVEAERRRLVRVELFRSAYALVTTWLAVADRLLNDSIGEGLACRLNNCVYLKFWSNVLRGAHGQKPGV